MHVQFLSPVQGEGWAYKAGQIVDTAELLPNGANSAYRWVEMNLATFIDDVPETENVQNQEESGRASPAGAVAPAVAPKRRGRPSKLTLS